jgi:membrane associated rhomboid family serine protease
MQELDILVFVSVFVEMLGPLLFWLLVLAIAVVTAGFVWVLIRDRGLEARRLVRAQVVGALGGVAAVLFMQWITNSGFRDIGGPVDLLLVALIFVLGAIGAAIFAYTVQAVIGGEPERPLEAF